MRTSAKLGLTALIAALLLSAAVTSASARSLSVSNQNIRVAWSRLEFVSSVTIRCQITLEGSFHSRTIAKVLGSLVGIITRATVKSESCTNAQMTVERLPWHLTYEGFGRILPNITEIFLLLRELLYQWKNILGTGAECRYGLATDNITLRGFLNATNEVTNLVPVTGRNTTNLLEARDNAFLRCPASLRPETGVTDGVVTLLGNTTRIRITLI